VVGKAIVEGGKGTAARTAGLLGGILSFAVSEGMISTSPAQGVKRPSDNHRVRRLSVAEYRQLGKALSVGEVEAETVQGLNGIWLLALSGCRSGEITHLKWDEVDEAGNCFRLVDSKEGASIRPMGALVFNFLAKIEKVIGCPYVLTPIRSEGPFGGLPGAWKRTMKRAELMGVTPHTLRHSYASVAGDLGFTDRPLRRCLAMPLGR
jgi:integrase